MDRILPTILATITQRKRDKVKLLWNDQIIVPNLFRIWEKVFWRKHGIRCEHSVEITNDEATQTIKSVKYHLYSWESKLSFAERLLRTYVSNTAYRIKRTLQYWDWKISRVVPQFGTIFYSFKPQFAISGFSITPKIGERPTGYLFAIAYDSLPQDQLSSSTPTVDIGSSSNRMLLSGTQGANAVDSVTAVTWNITESMTKQQSQQTGANRFQTVWSLTPVGTGSHSATIVGTLDIETFIVYSGVSQTAQPHNATVASGNSGTSQINITTSASTDWIFASLNNSLSGQTEVAGTTKRSGGVNSVNQANDSNGSVSPTSLGYTFTSSNWGAVGVSFSTFTATANNSVSPFFLLMGTGV